jgi:microcin C transport system substrate-binding protein
MKRIQNSLRRMFNFKALTPRALITASLIALSLLSIPAVPFNKYSYAQATQKVSSDELQALRSHAITVFGKPKYSKDFKNFDFVNPQAPKGGEFKMGVNGSFDSYNPFILKGNPAGGISNLIYETLMVRSQDERSTSYGLIAESVEVPDDKSYTIFHLREAAKWQDGTKVSAEDVVFSFNTLVEKGHPRFRIKYQDVETVEALDRDSVKFTFKVKNNRELPSLLGDLPVLPKHYWNATGQSFDSSSTVQPMGSGPYKMSKVNIGRQIIFEKDENWWGKNLAVNKGRYNFKTISFDYFLDITSLMSALGKGELNFRHENMSKAWMSSYEQMPKIRSGELVKEEIAHNEPAGMQGFVFNTRQEKFKDWRVRKAISLMFNFEWGNKALAYNAYTRTDSFFENSHLQASGLPKGRELELLEKYRDQLPARIFTQPYTQPQYKNYSSTEPSEVQVEKSIHNRQYIKQAFSLLKEAGYKINNGKLVKGDSLEPFEFEFMVASQGMARWILAFKKNLERLGIETSVRVVDSAQYRNRLDNFEYDMVVGLYPQTLTPGVEQSNYWHSSNANNPGARNYPGVSSPVVDDLIDVIIKAKDEDTLVAASRALDRVLLHHHYVIPQLYIDYYRVAHSKDLKRPKDTTPRYNLGVLENWWYEKDRPALKKPSP